MELVWCIVVAAIGGAIVGYECYPFFHPEEYIDAEIERAEEDRR